MATSPDATAHGPLLPDDAQQAAEPIAPDIALDLGGESDYFTDDDTSVAGPSSVSLSDSIVQYRRIHGRPYTQKIQYWGPNDDKQNDAMEINHIWQTIFLGDNLFLAPIGDYPQKVLDLGTGTGIWAIDFADAFPSARVTGIDISPIQPVWVPPNCKFQVDDIEQPWGWPDDYFDYIHVRNLEGCIANWPRLYEQAFKHLKPGGWFEIKEFDIESRSQAHDARGESLDEDHIYKRWASVVFGALERLGKPGTQTRDHGIADALGAAGFVDIVEHRWPIPIGTWPREPKLKEVGAFNHHYLDESLEGFSVYLLKEVLGWEDAEILAFVEEMRVALRDRKLAPYITLHLVYARKPER